MNCLGSELGSTLIHSLLGWLFGNPFGFRKQGFEGVE